MAKKRAAQSAKRFACLRRIEEIKPYERNPRVNDQAVDAVAESIRKFGFRQPIVVDKEGVIVIGHTRWKAAKKLGLEKVPVHVAEDLTPEQAREYRIVDNKTAELADWDIELLQIELDDIADRSFLQDLGIDLLLDEHSDPHIDPEEVPEQANPVTREGDIWALGKHRLICGDTFSDETTRFIKSADVRAEIIDPPFEMEKRYEPRTDLMLFFGRGHIMLKHLVTYIEEGWMLVSEFVCTGATAGSKKSLPVVVHCNAFLLRRNKYPMKPRWGVAKRIGAAVSSDGRMLTHQYGLASTFRKPVRLVGAVNIYVEKGAVVHDPFCGFGAGIIACELSDTVCYAVELKPERCDVVIERWQKLTGKKAKRIQKGK